jgi:hypothetical protein
MLKKSESGETTKKNGNGRAAKGEDAGKIDPRQHLLALVASNVASGVVVAPSESAETAEGIAEISVDIADAILKKIGL